MTNQKAAKTIKTQVNQQLRPMNITYNSRGEATLSYIKRSHPRQSVHGQKLSNTGRNYSGDPAAKRKKTHFEDDIYEFGVQLPPPTAVWNLLY